MQVSFALFADAANLSQEGKLNILGVFDALQVASFPAVHPRTHLVVHLKGTSLDVGTHAVTLSWVAPNGNELWNSRGELGVGAPPPGVTEMDMPLIALIDLPMNAPGTYTMTVSVDDEPCAQVPIQVRSPSTMAPSVPKGVLLS